jgi:hypothetical protein
MNMTSDENWPTQHARHPILDDPRFLLGDAAAAAGISLNLLKSWVTREPCVIPFGKYDGKPLGKGSARLFTLRRILSVSVAAELVALGVTASRAGLLAHYFTDAKHPTFDAAGGPTQFNMLRGDALLVTYPDHEAFDVIPENTDINLRQLLQRSGGPYSGPASSCAVLSYGAIAERVKSALAARGKPVSFATSPEQL